MSTQLDVAADTDLVRSALVENESAAIEAFRQVIMDYYHANGRSYPWRDTTDPYKIMVSEIMLQQTQTDRVVPKYENFLHVFPTVEALAKATPADVLAQWSGLGYNRRALNLARAAQVVVHDFAGVVPSEEKSLLSLPGIGPYTAAAIRAFAFNLPGVFIETNIRRIFIHFFRNDEANVHDKVIFPLIAAAAEGMPPREWYYALMDYGSIMVKQVPNPNRRSAHYGIQSKFSGSNRQLRGKILKLLLKGAMPIEPLGLATEVERPQFEAALTALQSEGFLTIADDMVELAG